MLERYYKTVMDEKVEFVQSDGVEFFMRKHSCTYYNNTFGKGSVSIRKPSYGVNHWIVVGRTHDGDGTHMLQTKVEETAFTYAAKFMKGELDA